jgi:probable HAF family extracellular repeat protein
MNTILFRTSLVGMLAASAFYAQSVSPAASNTSSNVHLHYSVADLGLVGGPPAQPFVIANDGLIAGGVAVSNISWHATLWLGELKADIGKPGLGGSSVATGINEWGQAVGEAETANLDRNGEDFCGFGSQHVCQPFIWQYGVMASLPLLRNQNGVTGANGVAEAINNRSQIVGTSENGEQDSTCPSVNHALGQYQQFRFKPVIWQNGTAQELPTVSGDPDGIAFAINDNGQAVGESGECTSFLINGDLTYLHGLHATLWENGTVTDLGNLGGVAGGGGNTAFSINNRGQVVGDMGTAVGPAHAYLWSKEAGIEDLGTLPGDFNSVALSINDNGDIVGISLDADFNARAFVRLDGGTLVDLNSLIPADSPLFLFDACSINSGKEIIGIAVDGAGNFHGYLATPSSGSQDLPFVSGSETSRVQFEQARRLVQRRLGFGELGARRVVQR